MCCITCRNNKKYYWFCGFRQLNLGKFGKFSAQFDDNFNSDLISMSIWNLKKLSDLKFWILKFQLFEKFNYLILCDTKFFELKLNIYSDESISFGYLNWFCKKNWIEKSQFGTKTQLLEHSLLGSLRPRWTCQGSLEAPRHSA